MPVPITAHGDLPPFPLEVLPDWLGCHAASVSAARCQEPDLAAWMALTVVAAGAAGRVVVSPQSGYDEPVNLYTLGVMGSGEGKSGVVSQMIAPLLTAERQLEERTRDDRRAAAVRKELADQIAADARKRAAKAPAAERAAAMEQAVALTTDADAIVIPQQPRLVADDATPESLATLLAEHGGRMAIFSAEGGIFDQMAGRYSKVPSIDVYLKAHSGDEIRVDRRARQERIAHPSLTLGLAVQPSVLEAIGSQPSLRGRGLVARFLAYMPESRVGRRDWLAAPPVDSTAEMEYRRHMDVILSRLLATNPFVDEPLPVARLMLAAEAKTAWLLFRQEVEEKLDDGGELHSLADWGNKLAGQVLRLAGVLHLAGTDAADLSLPIGVQTVEAAITISRYLIPHALAAFENLQPSEAKQLARKALKVIKERSAPGQMFSRKQLFDHMRGTVTQVEQLIEPLRLLQAYDWLAEVPYEEELDENGRRRPGRKPSPRFVAHPALWGPEETRAVAEAA